MGVPRLSLWLPLLSALALSQPSVAVDVSWHPPKSTEINDLDGLLNTTGVYGFIFDTSKTPDKAYGTYNWCNMPHVRKTEYKVPPKEYKLQYVEVIHRHHKRTPYSSNTFPEESYPWYCNDEGLFYYGQPMSGRDSSQTYWAGFENPMNPFKAPGFKGTCKFPQITKEGLDDSWQHGRDIYRVYHDKLRFLPRKLDLDRVSFRVTNNEITSQVAGMLIDGMYSPKRPVPLIVESSSTDTLEPKYSCPRSKNLFSTAKSAPNTPWSAKVAASQPLLTRLDAISGVPSNAGSWHDSVDPYFDNLSARLCDSKPLPCSLTDRSKCISRTDAETIFRLGQFEYSYVYRDAPTSLEASAGSLGVWVAELTQHIRDQVRGKDGKKVYRHNIAHDGSVSRLLSILQVDVMVWPGMGAEVVFELYQKGGKKKGRQEFFVRVLFGGQVLTSSSPQLGRLDMVPVEKLLGYFDGLVGVKAAKIKSLCEESKE
ncbi:hypothetical protein ACJ72_07725 [Emergomyces africanus]|uniref:Acid phosphatase n=1 Tax=Emergomyces africanus TaxID=1955775 RepID=A0A1B7NMZ7_9EURO|nr:hypothetical protein ACJ72_07725 [Emergomyces africanus]